MALWLRLHVRQLVYPSLGPFNLISIMRGLDWHTCALEKILGLRHLLICIKSTCWLIEIESIQKEAFFKRRQRVANVNQQRRNRVFGSAAAAETQLRIVALRRRCRQRCQRSRRRQRTQIPVDPFGSLRTHPRRNYRTPRRKSRVPVHTTRLNQS